VGPGNGFGHSGQGRVDLPGAGETVLQDLDLQSLSLVGTCEDGAGRWNACIHSQPYAWRFLVRDWAPFLANQPGPLLSLQWVNQGAVHRERLASRRRSRS